jgi:hypothetical protein
MRRFPLAVAALLLLAACGKKDASVLPDSWEVSLARAGTAWIAKDFARTYALCENGFAIAMKVMDRGRALTALDCMGEAAVKQEQLAKPLPHYEKFVAEFGRAMPVGPVRHRILNNHAVLLHESGRRDEAVEALREVVAASERSAGPVHMAAVRNLAIAWYGAASDPEAKAWVGEKGAWIQARLAPDVASRVGGLRGSGAALEALVAIGDRQALDATPAWRRLAAEAKEREEDLDRHDPMWRKLCETIVLGEIGLVACFRELSP